MKNLLGKLFSVQERINGYNWEADKNLGLIFSIDPSETKRIADGRADLWVTHQHVALRMLVEQGNAEDIPNGFIMPTDVAVHLDSATQDLLGLPPQWSGTIDADIQGTTGQSRFSVSLKVQTPNNRYTKTYTITGPIIQFTKTQRFILTPEQHVIFGALAKHQSSDKTEYDNLKLLLALQDGQKAGAKINLRHFDKLDIKAPESVSIEAELDSNGNLILTPFMGQDASHEKIERVLGQLRSKKNTALRVENEIILFDEKKLAAVHEILKNRIVPQKQVAHFLKNPTQYINASLVNLDIGFSVRVRGVTIFKHAYFGETDESGIDWFGSSSSAATILPVSKLPKYIHDTEKLSEFKAMVGDAIKAGADEISFANKIFDISDKEAVAHTIKRIEQKILEGSDPADNNGIEDQHNPDDKPKIEKAVVDIDLHDEIVDITSPSLEKSISEILSPAAGLDWSNYLRTPYPHQEIGTRWILGLAQAEEKYEGGLLADDMGLGKTFMALAAVDQLYKILNKTDKTKKPCLVVAPLSLLPTWKDEVAKTFSSSPFKDIILLQSSADLPRFRVGGVETRQQLAEDEATAEIRYSLKVGKNYLPDMLDIPERLVITTYQTLRDYQFSLCTIDWGMVIFDESQNIKNPNTLQTRAAKGLKADFKLLATGTPVENSLKDFWCLMDTACPGYLESYQNFRKTYVQPILQAAGDEIEEVRGQIGRELRLKVGPLMLRRLKEDNLEGLPQKQIFVGIEAKDWKYLPILKKVMGGAQLEVYDATLKSQADSESNVVLSALQRLRDVSLHPQLADRGMIRIPKSSKNLKSLMSDSGKMQSLLVVLNDIKKRGEKCIIFVVNKRLQQFLSLALGRYYGLGPVSIINGDTKAVAKKATAQTRKSIIADFEKSKGFSIIIMSPVAAGVGLTVIGANNVIHLERHWNPAKEAQATDRVYRIGQKKDVNIYVPILHHPDYESFDVNLHRLLSKKTLLKDAVVTPEQVIPRPEGLSSREVGTRSGIKGKDLYRLSWQQFEALCAELFVREFNAANCWLTQSGSDYGADVLLTSKSSGQLVQCKHTTSLRYDGYRAIQEIHGARIKYSLELKKDIDLLIFATNAKTLSVKTKSLAEQYQVRIISFNEIARLLEGHKITYEMILRRLGKARYNI